MAFKEMKKVLGKLIGQGRTSEVFDYGDNKIIKLFRKDFPKNAIEMEYMISLKLNESGMPSAKVFDFVECQGRFGIVYERIDGISMMRKISTKPWKAAEEAKGLDDSNPWKPFS